MLAAWLQRHPLCTFGALTLSFLLFGGLTLDLARVFAANVAFLAEHGWQAVLDQALWQLLTLIFKAMLAMLAYLVFKLCETVLIGRLGVAK